MPTTKEIERYLFSLAPKELALDWDNVGLLAGRADKEIHSILVALDITEEVVDEAIEQHADLIVAHHPVMNCKWHPVQSVRDDTYQGRLLIKMIQKDIAGICMHTNLDITSGGVNDALAEALQLTQTQPLGADGCGRIGFLENAISLDAFLPEVYTALGCSGLRYVSAGKFVHKVAVGGGACWDYHMDAMEKGCDTFVTSDLSYHNFLDAKAMGLNVIDAGHFPTEDVVCAQVITWLKHAYPQIIVQKSTRHKEVFQYYLNK